MPDKFVREAQWPILNSGTRQHDTVFSRSTANQSHVAHRLLVFTRAERPRPRDMPQITSVGQFHLKSLFADERMRKINRIRNGISIARINRDELIPLAHFQLAPNLQIFPRPPLLANPRLL